MSTTSVNEADNGNVGCHAQMATDKLFKLAQQGDQQAKEALAYRVYAIILRESQQLLGNKLRQKLQSVDIAQSVWIKFDAGLDNFTFNTENALRAYLNRLTRNHIRDKVDHFNAGARDTDREGGEISGVSGTTPTPSLDAIHNELLKKYEHCISRLPEQQQYIYEAVSIQGRSYNELAEELEKDKQLLYKSFNDAKSNLKNCMVQTEKSE